jgi:hypothetical protein
MINTALNRQKNSILLEYAIENFADEFCESLINKPEKVLQEIATQASKLFEHTLHSLTLMMNGLNFLRLSKTLILKYFQLQKQLQNKKLNTCLKYVAKKELRAYLV